MKEVCKLFLSHIEANSMSYGCKGITHFIIHLSTLIDVNTSHKVETPVDQYVVYTQ